MDEGNVTEEGRGKELNKAYKQGNKQGYNGAGAYDDDAIGYGGYGGYKRGIAWRFILFALTAVENRTCHACCTSCFCFQQQIKHFCYTFHTKLTHYTAQ